MNKVYWYTQKKLEYLPKLATKEKADVVIVGGGMAGLSAAEKIIENGHSVIILEKEFCGSGASGKTSGFITPDSEIELSALISNHGKEKAKKIWEFVLNGVEIIRKNIVENKIECDYQIQNSLFIANDSGGLKHTESEFEARRSLSYESVLHDEKTIGEIIGSKDYVGGVEYPDTFGINSYLYCQEMRGILLEKGVKIFEQSEVTSVEGGVVKTSNGEVEAGFVIVCTDRFIPELGRLEKEIYHAQTFLGISNKLSDSEIKKIFTTEKKMVWDTDLVYNYFRVTGENRLLIGGGDLFYTYAKKESNNTLRFKNMLTKYISKKFPEIKMEIEYIWPGLIGISKDLMPIIGPDKKTDRVWFVGAASGLPWAASLGEYIADKYLSNRNEFDEIFSSERKFIIGNKLQTLLTTPPTFAIANGITKYF